MAFLLIAKILSAVFAVLTLTFVAERVSPRAGGLLAGFPLGTAIALFFIGLENGSEFASQAALYALPGFVSAMMVALGYYIGIRLHVPFKIIVSSLLSILLFMTSAWVLQLVDYNLVMAIIFPSLAIPIFVFGFRQIENQKLTATIKVTKFVVTIRALSAAVMVLFITGIAAFIGPKWSGLLAAFPVSMLPFLIVVHASYGRGAALTIIKNYPAGLGALVVYTISVYFSYNIIGIEWGTFVSYGVASLYLIILWLGFIRQPISVKL